MLFYRGCYQLCDKSLFTCYDGDFMNEFSKILFLFIRGGSYCLIMVLMLHKNMFFCENKLKCF